MFTGGMSLCQTKVYYATEPILRAFRDQCLPLNLLEKSLAACVNVPVQCIIDLFVKVAGKWNDY